MHFLDINAFIKKHITEREHSLFSDDINKNILTLQERINDKSVLVIGGAGTIGSFFIKALLHFKPAKLYVVDINENGLTELTRDLRSSAHLNVPDDYKTYPINFGEKVFEKILKNEGPFHIIANFAAHKHVRSEKDHYSIEAMVDNNVLKAKKLLDLLLDYPPERFFCVSTDKAANPVNVMGASKKLMEDVILAYSAKIPITTARFANVAFSNGSLLFGFIERMMKRQPLSSPSDVRRYFVSPEESGQLCMLACILGDSGDIFFPKLREEQMKKFSDIAVAFLNEQGLTPQYSGSEMEARKNAQAITSDSTTYPVYFFPSDTSGEKHYEEFFTDDELLDNKSFNQLGIVKNAMRKPIYEIEQLFDQLNEAFHQEDLSKSQIVNLLKQYIPNFEHIETGKSLDQKM